jgi:cytochrome o ubiquinol oxidase subunit 1
MPHNTGAGLIISAIAMVLGFAMIWYIWWLAALAVAGLFVVAIGHSFNYDRDYHVDVADVTRLEGERTRLLAAEA